jgi:hypothetical protein
MLTKKSNVDTHSVQIMLANNSEHTTSAHSVGTNSEQTMLAHTVTTNK